jgi:HCOMODA/2-hydroxy-3-carboxy-muconic semialdehyde decarboxylase
MICGPLAGFAAEGDSAKREATIRDLVAANHILYRYDIVDGYGHISVRDPLNPKQYLLSRSMAPALVTAADIVTWDLDSNPVGGDTRKGYLERYIHGEIYKARPDVNAVVHCHTPAVIPFGDTNTPIKGMYHMGYFLAEGVPLFEIRDYRAANSKTMLVENPQLGAALAKTLGPHSVALMRGHGAVVVAPSIPDVVGRSFYLKVNADAQQKALALNPKVTYMEQGENDVQDHARDWQLWVNEETKSGCGGASAK